MYFETCAAYIFILCLLEKKFISFNVIRTTFTPIGVHHHHSWTQESLPNVKVLPENWPKAIPGMLSNKTCVTLKEVPDFRNRDQEPKLIQSGSKDIMNCLQIVWCQTRSEIYSSDLSQQFNS